MLLIHHAFCLVFQMTFPTKNSPPNHTHTDTIYEASNAVDGNTLTCMRTLDIGSNSPYKTVWWNVDLGGVYSINSINILFKNYDGYGL